jgi:hypothetical protein
MTQGEHRRFWSSTHSNGWCAWVAERPDGMYVAGVYGPGRTVPALYRRTFHSAGDAALHLLETWTHHRCGDGCTPWTESKSK